MKALIDRILRSAQRLQEFWELRKETQAAEYAFRREAGLHLRHSFKLWLKSHFRRWYNG